MGSQLDRQLPVLLVTTSTYRTCLLVIIFLSQATPLKEGTPDGISITKTYSRVAALVSDCSRNT